MSTGIVIIPILLNDVWNESVFLFVEKVRRGQGDKGTRLWIHIEIWSFIKKGLFL